MTDDADYKPPAAYAPTTGERITTEIIRATREAAEVGQALIRAGCAELLAKGTSAAQCIDVLARGYGDGYRAGTQHTNGRRDLDVARLEHELADERAMHASTVADHRVQIADRAHKTSVEVWAAVCEVLGVEPDGVPGTAARAEINRLRAIAAATVGDMPTMPAPDLERWAREACRAFHPQGHEQLFERLAPVFRDIASAMWALAVAQWGARPAGESEAQP